MIYLLNEAIELSGNYRTQLTNTEIDMAKEYKRTGISKEDADVLWELTEYSGLDKIANCHPPKFDRYLGGKQLHMKMNGMHINIY